LQGLWERFCDQFSDSILNSVHGDRGVVGKGRDELVSVFLAYYNGSVWTWVNGELYLLEHWFSDEMAAERKRGSVPAEREFATKIGLGWRMIQRAKVHFEAVACDDLDGRTGWLPQQMDQAGLVYIAEIPEDIQGYLTEPDFGVPPLTLISRVAH